MDIRKKLNEWKLERSEESLEELLEKIIEYLEKKGATE